MDHVQGIEKNLLEFEIKEFLKKKRAQLFALSLKSDNNLSIENIDKMSGFEFESFLEEIFTSIGYSVENIRDTKDQGVDLIVEHHGERTAIQAKRYSKNVSNSAVQQIFSAKKFYNCDRAMVVTNSDFTKSAKELAKSLNVELISGLELNKMIKNR